jgi:hypothetical protein
MWIRPGVDYTKYKKVMMDYVIFAFAEDSEYRGIDTNEMKKLADGASQALVNAIKTGFLMDLYPSSTRSTAISCRCLKYL